MVELLEVLLNIIFELLPAIGEVLPGIPVKTATTTQKTYKINTSRKRVWGQEHSADHQ